MNFHDLDNYNLADAVKFHQRLNPRLWGKDEHLLPEVRDKLLAIASDFQEFLGVDELNIQDITISGSNAAYSYTPHSDIDLHLVVDIPNDPVYQELFAAKKYQYNAEHNIKIAGVPVELYVQPADQKHVSQGIYSVKNGDWTQVPQRRRASVDDSCVQHKTADLDARIHSAIQSGDADAVNQLWEKIRTMRQTGLEQNGEFGCENIAFKLLRNSGCLGKLKKAKTAIQDRELSLARKPAPRKKMNYGMRDYWFPGTAYAGQDHPAGTESEQVDESADPDQLKKILRKFYTSCIHKLQLKNPPGLRLETTPDWSRQNGSFGQYEPESNTLILATHGRHVLDILRTMAHEMTHRQQDEKSPLPDNAGETGSPWEDQANAMAGRIMRDWAREQPEMFDGATLEEASGYIPTKKQARDPRFVMALTKDVRPGAVGKEANKLGLETDSQGHPALLTAGLNKLLREFKEQDLFEINMGGKNLRKEAAKTGALAGMEFEMIVPDTSSEDQELEPDFDSDERASSPGDIRDFFYDGDYNSRRSTQEMIDRIMDDYSDWQIENFGTRWDGDAEEFIFQYIKDNMDDNEIIELLDLEPDHDVTRQDYLLAADMIATEQMEPWYEDAKNDASDSFFEDDRFEDFLQDNNMEHMSDIYLRYDSMIHWPHYTGVGGGSTSVEDVADDFSKAVGRPAQARSDYHAYGQERPGPGKNFYVVEPDGSLEPDDPQDSGLEFVSPPLPIDEIMSDLNKVKAWANRMGCYTNDSTGLHINISVPNYSQDQLDYVKLALLMGDEYVLNNFGRAGNTYAKSAMGKIKGKVTPENAKQILDKMKSGLDQLATKAIHSGYTDKYTSINTKDGHIEFRSPGGDWLDDNFDKIENTLMRFTVAMSAALNPEAYRQEYLKKLYKMLAPKGENDPLAIFAKYSAGELPKAALKSFVRQAQLERGNKAAKQAELDTVYKELTPAPEESNQGNWGVWVPSLDRYATIGNSEPRRFLRHGDAQVWIQDYNTRHVGNNVELTVREIQPATAPAAPEAGSVQWNIVDNSGEVVHTFWNRNVQADADQATREWVQAHWRDEGLSVRGPFATVPAAMQPGQQRWHITDDNDQVVYRFTASTAQRDANDVARNWMQSQPPSMSARGPFEVVPVTSAAAPADADTVTYEIYNSEDSSPLETFQAANDAAALEFLNQYRSMGPHTLNSQQATAAFGVRRAPVPGSTLDLQRQRIAAASMAADAAPSMASQLQQAAMSNVTNPPYYPPPTPIPGVEDIDIDIPMAQTQWEVYNRLSNQPIFVMQAANQAEAWRIGQQWTAVALRDGTITDASNFSVRRSAQSVNESITVLEQRLRQELDAMGNQAPTGPESPPEMPAGTIKVDVSDMYDWYKLGQHISDLKSIDKSTLGKGPPSTVFAFGSEELENKYSHELMNLGLKTHDLDEPGEEDVDEAINPDVFNPAFNDTQIFDGLTYRATGIEINGKEYFQVKVLDDNYQQIGLAKFRPSKNGLVSAVTSLKPEYQGRGIARNIYAYVRMLGNTIVPSRNQLPPGKAMWDAWKKSGDAKHLMKDMAEDADSNIEIRSDPTSTGGVQVYAYRDGKEVGWVRFQKAGNGKVKATMVHVPERLRRQGIGSAMYKHARHELGLDIMPSDSQTTDGRSFWNKIHEVEEQEPTRIKLGNNNAAKSWIEQVYAKYPHTMQNNHVMVWGSGDDQQFAMFELIPSFSKRGAVEVKWIQAYPLRQGVGSRAMKELQAMAREDGISLTLFPWDKGQVSQSKLTKFYRGQGFTPTVKGGKAMQWEPK